MRKNRSMYGARIKGKVITFKDVFAIAEYLEVSKWTIYDHAIDGMPVHSKRGRIHVFKVGDESPLISEECTHEDVKEETHEESEKEKEPTMAVTVVNADNNNGDVVMTYSEAMREAYNKKKIILEGQKCYYWMDKNLNLRRHFLMEETGKVQDEVVLNMPFYDTIKDKWHYYNGIELTEKERNYIVSVIAPFKEHIKGIERGVGKGGSYLQFTYDDTPFKTITHFFKEPDAFKNMAVNFSYTLEEMGL